MSVEVGVVGLICDHQGCVEYEDLLQEAGDVEGVVRNRDLFTIIQQNKRKLVLVSSNIRRCRSRECQETCNDLHLCRFDLLGQCNIQRCRYGHSLDSQHNSRVLRQYNLHGLSRDQLRVLLLQNDSSLLPNVCVSYNKGSGLFGNCPDKEACERLHVCEKYIRGLCDGSTECTRCHDFYEPYPVKTLQARGVASHLIGSLLLIYRNILTLRDHRNARDKPGARNKEKPKPSTRGKVPESLQKNSVNVICLSYIRGNCKYGEKCWRVHYNLPYKWEVEVDDIWIELPDNEAIELDYCDPAKIHSNGGEPVCYDTMTQGLHRVRRVSTVSSVIEPTYIHTTKWVWYWEDEYHKWIQYGSVKDMHRLVSITCEELEKKYLQYLEDKTHDVVKFSAGKHFYELNFRDMKQRNEISDTERTVRRRPWFVSSFDVRTTRPRRGPMSSGHRGVPGFWDKTAIPESGFQRVLLDPLHKDYIRVQEHFVKTMKEYSILTIERVQNKELWEDFQTKRERMKKANSHKKYGEAERFLFHGTNRKNVDAICHRNFDMSASGTNRMMFGQGRYFARDAKYTHDYTDRYGKGSMFVCRVLVGQYAKGASHYHEPPPKDTAGNLYDSCVNDVREPTIYVIFKQSQVYPEFLITYEKTRVAEDTSVIQSNRTATRSESDLFDVIFGMRQTASSPHQTNSITFGTGDTFTAASVSATTADLNLPVNPAKDQTHDTESLKTSPSSQAPPKSVEFTDSLDPFACSSDKISGASSTRCLLETESETFMPCKTSSSVQKQPSYDGSLSFFSEIDFKSSEKASQSFDDMFDVSQTSSAVTTSSLYTPNITTYGPTITGQEFLTSTQAQGLTSPKINDAGLPRKSDPDMGASVKVPDVGSTQILSSGQSSLPGRSIRSDLLVTKQRSLSKDPELVTGFSDPLSTRSSTSRALNLSSDASSARESNVSVMSKTGTSAASLHSVGSLTGSYVSFYEKQAPSPPQWPQTPARCTIPKPASQKKTDGCIIQ